MPIRTSCPAVKSSVWQGINDIGTTILMVTHEHSLVRQFGGRIINIDQGQIVFDEVIGGNLIHES